MTGRERVTWLLSERLASLDPSLEAGAAWLEAAWEAESDRVLTRSRTTDTAVIDVPRLGPIVRKRWRWPGMNERLKGVGRTTALARTPAEREFAALSRAYGDTVFHPVPIAAGVARETGLARSAMLLMKRVPEAVDLACFLRDETDSKARRAVLDDLLQRLAAMHGAGVTDGDCHPRNVLVQRSSARTWKVDCARQRAGKRPAVGRRAAYDIACLDVGLHRLASADERAHFLSAYARLRGFAEAGLPFLRRVERLRLRIAPDETRRLPLRGDD